MHEDEDDELAQLLADEERVRDVLLAAVDGQLVPPSRTDLAEIVQRGRRRARMQVLAASVAAVVLIAAVALGASVLAHWNGSGQVSTANGSSSALPVTSQTITTTPNQPPTPVYADDASQPSCLYPGLTAARKWIPLNAKQTALFDNLLSDFDAGPMKPVEPAAAQLLVQRGDQLAVRSVEIYAHGELDLVTLSATTYTGPATAAAATDSKQEDMPQACTGTFTQRPLVKTPPINEYVVTPAKGTTGQARYLRAQVYDSTGTRFDLTEVVNPSGVPDDLIAKGLPTDTAPPAHPDAQPALTASQLAQIGLQIASY
jgi:hypothetical protein